MLTNDRLRSSVWGHIMSSILERAAVSLARSDDSDQAETPQSRRTFLAKTSKLAAGSLGAFGVTAAVQQQAAAAYYLYTRTEARCRYNAGTQYGVKLTLSCRNRLRMTTYKYTGVLVSACWYSSDEWHYAADYGCWVNKTVLLQQYPESCYCG